MIQWAGENIELFLGLTFGVVYVIQLLLVFFNDLGKGDK